MMIFSPAAPVTLDMYNTMNHSTVKPVLSGHSKRTPKLVFNTDYRLITASNLGLLLQKEQSVK